MQKWEYLSVDFVGGAGHFCPERIEIWPSGVLNLEWLQQKFSSIRIRINSKAKRGGYAYEADVIDRLHGDAPSVSVYLVQYLGLNGWETSEIIRSNTFKRRLQE